MVLKIMSLNKLSTQMNRRKIRIITGILITLVVLGLMPGLEGSLLFAQAPPPPSLPGMPDQAPIDGGIALLAAAGGALAWKRLRNKIAKE